MAIEQLSNFGALKNATQQIKIKPQNLKGIAGFIFDITERESIRLESEITDHYIEDNTTIQDHIALKPIEFSITGSVGELIYSKNGSTELIFNENTGKYDIKIKPNYESIIEEKLLAFSPFAPDLAQQASQLFNQVQNLINKAKDLNKAVKNIYNLFNDVEVAKKETRQAKAYEFFKALWENRQYFTIDTYWATFDNMAIISIEVDQTDTDTISTFNIKFKQLRFAQTILTSLNSQGRRANQTSKANNKGKAKGQTKSTSLLKKFYKKLYS